MNSLFCATLTAALVLASTLVQAAAQSFPDFSQLPAQTNLPSALTLLNGEPVTTARQWKQKRRPELQRLFEHYMYGEIPPKPRRLDFKTTVIDEKFLNGKATLKNVAIGIPGSTIPKIDLLVITPNDVRKAPVFLTLNFCGNHAIHPDPRIPLAQSWLGNSCKGCTNNHATDASRGSQSKDWPLEEIIGRGYALATFANADVDSDRADASDGVYAWLAKEQGKPSLTENRGCIAGWAWGFERCVDYLVTDGSIDKDRIAAVGHSRNGKTALLAAAFDERIALAIPHQAGSGGTGPSRVAPELAAPQKNGRPTAETIAVINKNFPHWFNAEFKKFNEEPSRLPFDQHCLVALMAPRPVLLSNADGDRWANPSGQFEMLKAAEPVYKLLKAKDSDVGEKPPIGKLLDGKLGYFVRPGSHSMTSEDWGVFLDFADRHIGKKR